MQSRVGRVGAAFIVLVRGREEKRKPNCNANTVTCWTDSFFSETPIRARRPGRDSNESAREIPCGICAINMTEDTEIFVYCVQIIIYCTSVDLRVERYSWCSPASYLLASTSIVQVIRTRPDPSAKSRFRITVSATKTFRAAPTTWCRSDSHA